MRGLIFIGGEDHVDYEKQWLNTDEQMEKLRSRGLIIENSGFGEAVLLSIGYYRLTGYLYPFLESHQEATGTVVGRSYRPGTRLEDAVALIEFDREFRLGVLDGIERFEVALRTAVGHTIGKTGPYAYEDPNYFDPSFTASRTDSRDPSASRHIVWLSKVKERRDSSDENFVVHFRDKYDDRMPIWALVEILELGQLAVLYRGMPQRDAELVAAQFGVPQKKIFSSWVSSLNYVRNVAAHHSRLFNRKLQYSPRRPAVGLIPELDHLRASASPKAVFGTYNAIAVLAYLLRSLHSGAGWSDRMVQVLQGFPKGLPIGLESVGVPEGWLDLALWRQRRIDL